HSVHARVLLEATVIQVCHLPDLQAISDLAAATAGSGKGAGEKKKRVTVANPTAESPTSSVRRAAAQENETASVRIDSASEPVSDRRPAVAPTQSTGAAVAAAPVASAVAQAPPVAAESPAVAQATATQGASGEQATSTTSTDGYPLISSGEATTAWAQVLQEMDPMTATLAKAAERVDSPEPGVLRLVFPGSSGLALSRCQMPEHKDEILRTLARVTGRRATLQFEATAVKKAEPVAAAKPKNRNRMQRMREIQANPLVQACVELLGAEIVRVDTPRG
ncbi:MAG: DNA polymerase III subunit gamma/tau, partial [Rhodopirellula sp. JB055]